ncbi:MAG: acetate/propionate family kinase [Acidimicrobiia bacterium]
MAGSHAAAPLMRVLVVNAGSATLKLAAVTVDGEGLRGEHERLVDPWHDGDDTGLESALAEIGPVDAVGHRVVHGGSEMTEPTLVDDAVLDRIEALTSLAPLHQPRALAGLSAARRLRPEQPHVACFDTAFHATMPAAARTYALPQQWRERWGLDRFGFHGLSHAWSARRGPEVAGVEARRTVVCHLGSGASLCAVLDGRSVDTTMGFTPLEGLVMGTRSGTVDPGLVLWLLEHTTLTAAEVEDGLVRRAGLAGLSGTDGDLRHVLAERDEGSAAAALAVDVMVHRLVRELGGMVASLGGLDLLVFTAGIGEHVPEVRAAVAERLVHLGVAVDPARNDAAEGDTDLTADGAPVATVVVEAREGLEIARQVHDLLI